MVVVLVVVPIPPLVPRLRPSLPYRAGVSGLLAAVRDIRRRRIRLQRLDEPREAAADVRRAGQHEVGGPLDEPLEDRDDLCLQQGGRDRAPSSETQ